LARGILRVAFSLMSGAPAIDNRFLLALLVADDGLGTFWSLVSSPFLGDLWIEDWNWVCRRPLIKAAAGGGVLVKTGMR
jgi:hypothetical protein